MEADPLLNPDLTRWDHGFLKRVDRCRAVLFIQRLITRKENDAIIKRLKCRFAGKGIRDVKD